MSRRHLDFYETPVWQTVALRRRVGLQGTIFEPCVGDGSIAEQFEDCNVTHNDIDPRRPAHFQLDATKPGSWEQFGEFDVVITNPPFNAAFDILRHALPRARFAVVMLLRLSFLEPTKERSGWLSENPPSRQIILPRWKYDPNSKGTDSVTTAWMVWYAHRLRTIDFPIEIVPLSEKGQR